MTKIESVDPEFSTSAIPRVLRIIARIGMGTMTIKKEI
jgi:hypothetical protein